MHVGFALGAWTRPDERNEVGSSSRPILRGTVTAKACTWHDTVKGLAQPIWHGMDSLVPEQYARCADKILRQELLEEVTRALNVVCSVVCTLALLSDGFRLVGRAIFSGGGGPHGWRHSSYPCPIGMG